MTGSHLVKTIIPFLIETQMHTAGLICPHNYVMETGIQPCNLHLGFDYKRNGGFDFTYQYKVNLCQAMPKLAVGTVK